MPEIIYVVVGEAEYDGSWVVLITRDKDEAVRIMETHSEEDRKIAEQWDAWDSRYTEHLINKGKSVAEAIKDAGPEPASDRPDADDYRLLEVPIGVWGNWT